MCSHSAAPQRPRAQAGAVCHNKLASPSSAGRRKPAQLRLRSVRVRRLPQVPPGHREAAPQLRRAGVRRAALQRARQRPCHRRALAAKTLAIHSIDVAVAARKLGVIRADVAVALSLAHHKAVGFDRRFPEVDFDALNLPAAECCPSAPRAAPARTACATVRNPDNPFAQRGDRGRAVREDLCQVLVVVQPSSRWLP